MTLGMLEILRGGGFTHRRAELRRQAAPPVDRPRPTCSTATSAGWTRWPGRCSSPASILEAASSTPTATPATPAGTASSAGRSSTARPTLPSLHERALDTRRAGARVRRPGAAREPRRPPRRRRCGPLAMRARRRRRLVDHRDQGRGARPRQRPGRRARVGAASADAAAALRAGPGGVVGGVRVGVAAGRRRRTSAAISVAGQQHGMVALDERRRGHPPGQAVERHRVGARRGVADRPARRRPRRRGPTPAASCRSPASRSPSCRGCTAASRRRGARLAHVVLPHDWLTFRLTGRLVTDRGDASGTGYWSAATGAYRYDLLAIVDADRDWSAAVPAGARAGRRRRRVAAARSSAPGTGDNMAGALGVGLRSGDVAVSIGTSGTVYSVSDDADRRPVRHRRRLRRRHRPLPAARVHAQRHQGHRRRRAGCSASTTTAFDELALAAPPGAGGLTLLPYLDGERTPDRPDGDRRARRHPQRRQPRAARPGRRRGRGVRPARRARRAQRVRARRRPADPRRRRRPLAGLPPGARRPQRARRARAARRRAGRDRRVRAGRRRGHRRASRPTSPTAGSSATATSSSRARIDGGRRRPRRLRDRPRARRERASSRCAGACSGARRSPSAR